MNYVICITMCIYIHTQIQIYILLYLIMWFAYGLILCCISLLKEVVKQLFKGEGWEMLRMQIYSVTEVPSEQMKLFGLGLDTGWNSDPERSRII